MSEIQQFYKTKFGIATIIVANIMAYLYYKFSRKGYKFQGNYSVQNVGQYKTEIMSVKGKYQKSESKGITIVCIAGNPGVIQFYDKFLMKLHSILNQELDIFCIGHINQSMYKGKSTFKTHTLDENIRHKQIFLKQLLEENPERRFILIGHSVGGYMCLHAMKVLTQQQIIKTYMLYATVFGMFQTPSGRDIRIFYPSTMQHIFATLMQGIKLLTPEFLLRSILNIGYSQSRDCVEAIIQMISYSNAMNAFRMGRIEMDTITDLDKELVSENLHKCFWYFGQTDGWVPLKYVDILTKTFPEMKYQLDEHGLQHAFVLGGGIKQAELQAKYIQSELPFL